jgi:hypothetical protein
MERQIDQLLKIREILIRPVLLDVVRLIIPEPGGISFRFCSLSTKRGEVRPISGAKFAGNTGSL